MSILGLDLSTNTGFAIFEDQKPTKYGNIQTEKDKIADYGTYPLNYLAAAEDIAQKVLDLIEETKPETLVIEETNKQARFSSRYSTKILEFIHCLILNKIKHKTDLKIVYLSTGDWRRSVNIKLTKEHKKLNAKMSKARREGKKIGDIKDIKDTKIKGKITNKHLAVQFVNAKFGMSFKLKDNDIAEAMCLVEAFLCGCKQCDGVF
jgi:hypothetical protein